MSKKAFAIAVATGFAALTFYRRCAFGTEVKMGDDILVKSIQ
jgi:hypothetical protein